MKTRSGTWGMLGMLGMLGMPLVARAQQPPSVDLLATAELWKTDSGSVLLRRNHGQFAPRGTVHVFASWRPTAALELRAIGAAGAGHLADNVRETTASIELLVARFTRSPALAVEAGRIIMPVGAFGVRRFANVNPLIGSPDLYPTQYPWGGTVSGAVGTFDYRAGMMSLPTVNIGYTPVPSARMRPALGAGFSVGPFLRIGASWTRGPYLGSDIEGVTTDAVVPAGTRWFDYHQAIVATDFRVSAGYFDMRGEVAWSRYEVPTLPDVKGFGWYVEPRITLSPRWFVAARAEYFDYPAIGLRGDSTWRSGLTLEQNGEIGVGYRVSADALLKVSARRDNWPGDNPSPFVIRPNGYAFAMQLSYGVSLTELLAPRY